MFFLLKTSVSTVECRFSGSIISANPKFAIYLRKKTKNFRTKRKSTSHILPKSKTDVKHLNHLRHQVPVAWQVPPEAISEQRCDIWVAKLASEPWVWEMGRRTEDQVSISGCQETSIINNTDSDWLLPNVLKFGKFWFCTWLGPSFLLPCWLWWSSEANSSIQYWIITPSE